MCSKKRELKKSLKDEKNWNPQALFQRGGWAIWGDKDSTYHEDCIPLPVHRFLTLYQKSLSTNDMRPPNPTLHILPITQTKALNPELILQFPKLPSNCLKLGDNKKVIAWCSCIIWLDCYDNSYKQYNEEMQYVISSYLSL